MTPASVRYAALAGLLLALMYGRSADEVLLGRSDGHQGLDAELQAALSSVTGCGAATGTQPPRADADAVKRALGPMWQTLPKNPWGNVDWAMVRYASHRYFMGQYGFLMKGFEPATGVDSSSLGSAEILSREDHPDVDALLKRKAGGKGFSLDDAAVMLATLEQLVHDGEGARLEQAYKAMWKKPGDRLTFAPIVSIIETYILMFMVGEDKQLLRMLFRRPMERFETIPYWQDIREFTVAVVRQVRFEAFRAPQPGSGRVAMQGSYSFEDVHRAVGYITRNFASFLDTECQSIKASLVEMDKLGLGRVAVSDFYGAKSDGNWRFGESEEYLRELGALDETSAQRGTQVIIPNYLQAASNSFAINPHYMVCCMDECDEVLGDIYDAVGAPEATAEAIFGLVQQMTNFDDESPSLDGTLRAQLHRVEQVHGGRVPLHGRLFAQWLHYAFPWECAVPHKAGETSVVSPVQYGDGSLASDRDVRDHSARRKMASVNASEVDKAQWMSLGSDDEELEMDLNPGLAPWDRAGAGSWLRLGCFATAVLALAWSLLVGALQGLRVKSQPPAGSKPKTHFV